jgi:propionyl-CoA carboxylase beta chain
MAAAQAVGIINRREIAAAPDPAAHHLLLTEQYATDHQSAHAAARDGFIDEIIGPDETRDRLSAALSTFEGKNR